MQPSHHRGTFVQQFLDHRLYQVRLRRGDTCTHNPDRHPAPTAAVFRPVGKHQRMDGTYLVGRQRFLLLYKPLYILVCLLVSHSLKVVLQRLAVYGDALQHKRCLLQGQRVALDGSALVRVLDDKLFTQSLHLALREGPHCSQPFLELVHLGQQRRNPVPGQRTRVGRLHRMLGDEVKIAPAYHTADSSLGAEPAHTPTSLTFRYVILFRFLPV